MVKEWRFCLSDVALQRYDFADFEKNTFSLSRELYTVTRDGFELRKAAHVFGWWWGSGGRTSICGMAKD